MDPAAFQLMQETEDMEDVVEADLYNTQLSAALLILGAEESRVLRSEHRNQTRNYLCRPQNKAGSLTVQTLDREKIGFVLNQKMRCLYSKS